MHMQLPLPRYQIRKTQGGVIAVVPSRKSWFVVAFLCAWLGGWFMGETSVISQLIHSKPGAPDASLIFWLAGWTLGGLYVMLTMAWQVFGKELIGVGSGVLTHRVEVLGVGRSRSFALGQVGQLRCVPFSVNVFTNQAALMPPVFGSGQGAIAFDYGARTFRIAPSLDEAEARTLVGKLQEYLPMGGRAT